MPNAFVIMPFDHDFEVLYTDFIRPVLEQCGFDVERADDIENHRNILRDIIEAIDRSELVVAELTGNNPNVLYELGLAHALKKSVIHLTQELDEVPFDLRSYRILEYGRDFSKIQEAKVRLANIAGAHLEGRSRFGNPITDFYGVTTVDGPPGEDAPNASTGSGWQTPAEVEGSSPKFSGQGDGEGEHGFLDYLVDVNDGYTLATEVSRNIVQALGNLTYDIEQASNELFRITANPNSSTPTAAVAMCRRLAERFANFNRDVSAANTAYAEVLENTEDSLELLFAFQAAHIDRPSPEMLAQINVLGGAQQTISEACAAILSFADTVDGLPRIERRFNRESGRTSIELRATAGLLERIGGSISRAINSTGTIAQPREMLDGTAT